MRTPSAFGKEIGEAARMYGLDAAGSLAGLFVMSGRR